MTIKRQLDISAPRSRFYQGPYGRLFPELSPWSPTGHPVSDEAAMRELAIDMVELDWMPDLGELVVGGGEAQAINEKHGSNIPAGYTYLGQFLDHDITFDPASSLMRKNDPQGLHNHRTPRIDLDSLYGGGPQASPHLYDQKQNSKFLVDYFTDKIYDRARAHYASQNPPVMLPELLPDLPRNRQGVAIIGDPRNDDNSIVSQLHTVMLLAHNTLVDRAIGLGFGRLSFERARTTLRWLYQYIVWHDFLARLAVKEIHDFSLMLERNRGGCFWKAGYADVYDWKNQPFIPVEFSVAAYRMGHSMVRPFYRTCDLFQKGRPRFIPLFNDSRGDENLKGGRRIRSVNCIQWDWFFPMLSTTKGFPQKAGKINPAISNALYQLPDDHTGMTNLAYRNLMRGLQFSLPSGTDIALRLGVTPLDLDNESQNALWYYILKEGEENDGNYLGTVGSVILCATFAGLLLGDPNSYFKQHPDWHPDDDPLLEDSDNRDNFNTKGLALTRDQYDRNVWTISSLVRLSGINPAAIGLETPSS